MPTQQEHLVVLLIMAVCSLHATCMGFPLPENFLPQTMQPPSLSDSIPTLTTSQESETSEQHKSTELWEIIHQSTDSTPEMNSSSNSEAVAFQVELYMDLTIPPIAGKVALGSFAVKQPGQFAIGAGLDLERGIFIAPYQGIYYFSASVHIKQFPRNTTNLSGSLAVGVQIGTEGNLQDASLSATVPFQMEGFNTQVSGFLQLEKGQSVMVLLVNSCNADFTIKSSSSLSIFKIM